MELLRYTWLCALVALAACSENACSSIYVRWPRVRLNLTSRVTGPYSLEDCGVSCSKDEHPARSGYPLQCSGFNHKHGATSLTNDCQLFQKDQVSLLEGSVEYDDRYSFYWKYCAKTKTTCKSPYQFDFHIDRYMDYNESQRRIVTSQVEDCLEECLAERSFECRSVSFNRTAGYCYLSGESRLSKPTSVRINGNPNYRIDYYENKCNNDSFTFHHECQQTGVVVSVNSKFPYTGAMYGLYDFFSCRVEPKEETNFHYFFPFASASKNCSDSMSLRDGEYVLEVVLSTDNVVPLYFLTDEDTIYRVKCPAEAQLQYLGSTIGAQFELIPSLARTEVEKTIAPSTVSSSTHSVDTPSTTETSSQATFTWTKSSTTSGQAPDGSQGLKKPADTLPSLDLKPESTKSESTADKTGNRITLYVKYPQSTNESEWNGQNSSVSNGSSSVASNSSETSTTAPSNTSHSTDQAGNDASAASTVSEEHAGSSTTTDTTTSTQSTTSTTSDSTSTTIETTSSTTSPTTTTEASTSTDSSPSTTATTETTSTSTSSSQTLTSTTTSSEPTTTSSPSSTSSTTSPASSSTDRSWVSVGNTEEDLNILPAVYHYSASSGSPSSTTPDWLTAWRFRLASIASASPEQSTATTESTQSALSTIANTTGRPDPALNIDSVQSIYPGGKSKDVDYRMSATTETSSTSVSSTTTSTESTTTSTTWTPSTELTSTSSSTTSQPTSTSSSTSSPSTHSSVYPENVTSSSTNSTSTSYNDSSTRTTEVTNGNEWSANMTKSEPVTIPTTFSSGPPKKILFDVFHNEQSVSAVVVGSRITLSFIPSMSLPGSYMTLVGCQVEPVNSPYVWERDPLQIVKNGCQADGVGLVCPPVRTDAGVKVEMEAFRYTTTGEVLYSCLIRVCPYGPCPQPACTTVDGCTGQHRSAAVAISPALTNPALPFGRRKRQGVLPGLSFLPLNTELHQHLISLAGDHVLTKKLVVVNSETELQYYLRTGNVPNTNYAGGLTGR